MVPNSNHSHPLALITGASSGIGETFARRLAARGFNLVLVARRRDRLEELQREFESSGDIAVEVLAVDLTQPTGMCVVEEKIASAENLQLVVNNAGFGSRGLFHTISIEKQELMHRLHVIATMRLSHAALRRMAIQRSGSIVNVSSVAGFLQGPSNVSYCATKAWMNSFTEGLYLELRRARLPIKVQALCPGFTHSEFHDTMGMDRGVVPKNWWMTSEDVVDASLRGLERGDLFVVPGWRYNSFVKLLRLLPRPLRHTLVRNAR